MRRYIVFLLIVIALYAGGRIFLYWKMESVIAEKIAEAQSPNICIQYKSLNVDYWLGDVSVDSLVMKLTVSDTICRICGDVARIKIAGISMLSLIFKKELVLRRVKITQPSFSYDERYGMPDRKRRKPNALKSIQIDQLTVDSVGVELIDSATHVAATQARGDVAIEDLKFPFSEEPPKWSVGRASLKNFAADFKKALYHVTVNSVVYDRREKTVKLDSLHVIPSEEHAEFAKKSGHQVDQFNCIVPSISIEGFEMDTSGTTVGHVGLSFRMDVYRDKRYPLKHRKPRRMPVAFMDGLGFKFRVDSINVYPSSVTYEEFPENGASTGKIHFNDLTATLSNVSNDTSKGPGEMKVHSRFMESGKLRAHFTFPVSESKPYTVNGALTDFSLTEINPMLIPVGNIKVESGKMREMKFHFVYNSFRSDGELEVNYSDLKVVSLKKDDHRSQNKLLSLLIGAFIKKDIDAKDSKDQRTGKILWERDTQKGILNYWWKSVLSGVKSVYNLDKIMKSDGKK